MNLTRYLQKSIRIEKKILKYTSHQNFIARCIQESVVPKGFQIKWNMCLDATDSDKDRYRDILFQSSIQLMHAALSTCEENLKQFKLKFDRFLVVFLYLLAVYVLQLTKTVVPSKYFAILCLNVFIISMKKYFV